MANSAVKNLLNELDASIASFYEPEKYNAFLNVASIRPDCSLNNMLLIANQCPEASVLQSFENWKSLERFVIKGQKGIKIVAPDFYKKDVEETVEKANGEIERSVKTITVAGYKLGYLYDISQTQGKDVAEQPRILDGSSIKFERFIKGFEQSIDCHVTFKTMDGRESYYSPVENEIAVGVKGRESLRTLSYAEQHRVVQLMLGEYAHYLQSQNELSNSVDKELFVSETVAAMHIVFKNLGIESADFDASFLREWAQGKELKELKESMKRVKDLSHDMIHDLQRGYYKVVGEEREQVERVSFYVKSSSFYEHGSEEKIYDSIDDAIASYGECDSVLKPEIGIVYHDIDEGDFDKQRIAVVVDGRMTDSFNETKLYSVSKLVRNTCEEIREKTDAITCTRKVQETKTR